MRYFIPFFVLLLLVNSQIQAQTREELVRGDRKRVEAEGFWIYNDLIRGFAEATRTGKPMIVVLRCLPCEECVKLDDELMEKDPEIRKLLESFVRVRQVATNGIDLNLFQFDTDQSFAIFFLNANREIYGRFGTRSDRTEWEDDVSLEGLGKALKKTLELHANYEKISDKIKNKRGKPMEVLSPELYPSLKGKFTDRLNYEGDVVKSCIHCHQIGDAQREYYFRAGKPIPEKILWPYPHPKSLGLILDSKELATIKKVLPESEASAAGFKPGDRIEELAGQPMLSIADVQWVLHNTKPAGGQIQALVKRGDKDLELQLVLQPGWRKKGDLSWRVSSWPYRRIATGGLLLESASDEQKKELGVEQDKMALTVKHVGKYGAHAVAGRAGVKKGDVMIKFDGREDLKREQDLHAYVLTSKKPGERVAVELSRGGKVYRIQLPIQK